MIGAEKALTPKILSTLQVHFFSICYARMNAQLLVREKGI